MHRTKSSNNNSKKEHRSISRGEFTIKRSSVHHIPRIKDITIVIINSQMACCVVRYSTVSNIRTKFQNTKSIIQQYSNSTKHLIFYLLSSSLSLLLLLFPHSTKQPFANEINTPTNVLRFSCVTTSYKNTKHIIYSCQYVRCMFITMTAIPPSLPYGRVASSSK